MRRPTGDDRRPTQDFRDRRRDSYGQGSSDSYRERDRERDRDRDRDRRPLDLSPRMSKRSSTDGPRLDVAGAGRVRRDAGPHTRKLFALIFRDQVSKCLDLPID